MLLLFANDKQVVQNFATFCYFCLQLQKAAIISYVAANAPAAGKQLLLTVRCGDVYGLIAARTVSSRCGWCASNWQLQADFLLFVKIEIASTLQKAVWPDKRAVSRLLRDVWQHWQLCCDKLQSIKKNMKTMRLLSDWEHLLTLYTYLYMYSIYIYLYINNNLCAICCVHLEFWCVVNNYVNNYIIAARNGGNKLLQRP